MGSFLGVMRRGVGRDEVDPSSTSSTEVGNEWSYTSIPPQPMPSCCAKTQLYLSLLPGRRKCSCQCTAIMAFVTYFMVNVATSRLFPYTYVHVHSFIHSFSILSDDRSKASSKTIPPHSAI